MWPNGYYYQRQEFYNYRWTKKMEQTFLDSLLEHARHGQFHAEAENRHAVHCSLRSVNLRHGTRVTAPWAASRVKKLQDRYETFNWLIHRQDVVWNRNLKFVTADDNAWEDICREKKLARCYINAYEDMFEDLCVLFGEPVPNEEVVVVQAAAPVQPAGELIVDHDPVAVEEEPVGANADNPIVLPAAVVNIISDSSDSSGDFWRVLEENYGSDSDPDSVLAMPGVPSFPPPNNDSPAKSTSVQSQGGASSTASNATPMKKEN